LNCFGTVVRCVVTNDINAHGYRVERYELLEQRDGRVSVDGVKQHLRIKSFFGTSENAIKSQIWIAISVYILVAIIKNRLDSNSDLYIILRILSLTLFENTLLALLVTRMESRSDTAYTRNQRNLFDNFPGQ